jgi:hypothetical protein
MALSGSQLVITRGYGSLLLTCAGLTAAVPVVLWAFFRVRRGELTGASAVAEGVELA